VFSNIENTINYTDDCGCLFSFEPGLAKKDENDPLMVSTDGTGICKFFLKGTCQKGNNCQFRHSKSERSIVCKHWLRFLL
jgi:cleavage and polyadenylation specificity factor subunit 4